MSNLTSEQVIERTLKGAQADLPTSSTFEIDLAGRRFDYGHRGELRVVQNFFDVDAIDAKSFIDHRNEITDAVAMAAVEGHPITQEIRSQIGG